MPKEIFDEESFLKLSESATNCIIKRNLNKTKLKLRTPRYLYTIVLDSSNADELVRKINCPLIEV